MLKITKTTKDDIGFVNKFNLKSIEDVYLIQKTI